MKVYYFGKYVGEYKMRDEREELSGPTPVGEILKTSSVYKEYVKRGRTIEVRHA